MQEEEEPELAIHTDAAELGWGGTVSASLEAGAPGDMTTPGLWGHVERRESITCRELRAFRLRLEGTCGRRIAEQKARRVRFFCDKLGVVHIIRAMVSASCPMMKELRRLERVLRVLELKIEPLWLPSAANVHADTLSREWDPGDIQVMRRVVDSLTASYRLGENAAIFPYRQLGLPLPLNARWQ